MEEKILYWLWLTEVFSPASPRKWIATSRFDSVEECYEAYSQGDYYGLEASEISRAKKVNFDEIKKIVEYCDNHNIKIYCYESEDFPQRLRDIYNPPSVIFVKTDSKNLDFLDNNVSIAVVGSRKIDPYYTKVTERIVEELVSAKMVINSGFAVGVDQTAHKTAIKNGGKTIAVLGSGIDWDYPEGTMKFKEEVSQNGAVISEFPPLYIPRPYDFIARNRVLSGLSDGVFVTQAGLSSGSLNTVSHALQQGKDIFCIPPKDVLDEKYAGVIGLLRDGAIPVFDGRDILYEYYEIYSHKISVNKNLRTYVSKTDETNTFTEKGESKPEKTSENVKKHEVKATENKANEVKEAEEVKIVEPDLNGLSEIQKKICISLKGKQLIADEISRELGIDIMDLYGELTEMELLGKIKCLPGKRYSL